ncbi:MAG: hypothetical protein EOM76_11060, partial [Sphingobacteriia bacterium]|nr:hypothetical protein [Sphingobacteriia bacterium]
MSILHEQTLYELGVAQGFTNDLAANLNTQGVAASNTEGLDTLVPKVLQIESGVAQSPYDEWQEGFNADWDSVIQNAPQSGVNPILHVYSKTNSIRHVVSFPTTVIIVTYNPTTGIYRPVVLDTNKNLFFEESDYFMNNHDGLYYTCVVYMANLWGNWCFRTTLPVVYSNTKFSVNDLYISLMNDGYTVYPFLRGVDCYNPNFLRNFLRISGWLEHLSVSIYQPSITIAEINGSDTQVRLLKEFVENAPINTNFNINNAARLMEPTISDDKLADWFFNDFFYNNFNGTAYGAYVIITTKNVRKFRINSSILLTSAFQLNCIPNCVYLDGTFTENQLNDATSAGIHNGFRTNAYTLLQNFPMWTVLEGATTGCLLPRPEGSTVSAYANFIFYSKNLERKYFCEFDENGTIIEDPTKY